MNNPANSYAIYSGTVTSTTNSTTITVPIGDIYTFIVGVSAVTGTSPTLDIVWQNSYDDGTSFQYTPFRTSQIAAAREECFSFSQTSGSFVAADSIVVAATGGIISEGFVFSRYGRFVLTVGGTNPSFTVGISLYSKLIGT